jgi:hypothetical protein
MYCFGGAEESKRGDGDAAATVAHAVKGGDGEETKRASTRLLRCRTRWRPWECQACVAAAASEACFAAAASRSPRYVMGRRKRTTTRLLRRRTQWRSWERPAFIRAAAPRRGLGDTETRLLRLRLRWPYVRKLASRSGTGIHAHHALFKSKRQQFFLKI